MTLTQAAAPHRNGSDGSHGVDTGDSDTRPIEHDRVAVQNDRHTAEQHCREQEGNSVTLPLGAKRDPNLWGIGRNRYLSICFFWSEWQDLNLRPPRPERGALPGCATLRDQTAGL